MATPTPPTGHTPAPQSAPVGSQRPPKMPQMPRKPAAGKTPKKAGATGVAAFATVVAFGFFSIPFVAHMLKGENFNSRDQPLNASQIRRGVYMNTGSKDVGVDKDWDFETNTYRGRRSGARAKREEAGEQRDM
ncbi:hypothetical protein PINS_up013288 [Pythium insidiosum]|nr:hypothetical protein PINS_up013288 [Pythium insidiosum]